MKTFINTIGIALALAVLSAPVMASDITNTNTANSGSLSGAAAVNDGNSLSVDASERTTVNGSDLGDRVPDVVAPGLTTTLSETCMGSISLGASFSGFGLGGGKTLIDADCVNRLNAREIARMGHVDVATEIMCENDVVRQAFKLAAKPCLKDQPEKVAQMDAANEQIAAMTVIREEKGLAPLGGAVKISVINRPDN